MRWMNTAGPLSVLAILLAGCADGGADGLPNSDETDATDPDGVEQEEETLESEQPAFVPPVTYYLTGDQSMTNATPMADAATAVPIPWSWGEVVTGGETTRFSSPPAAGDFLVESITGTAFITTEGAAVTTPILDEIPVWIGTDEGMVASTFAVGPDALQPGEIASIGWTWELPNGGLVVPEGRMLAVAFGNVYISTPAEHDIHLLVGSSAESTRLEMTTSPLTLPAADEPATILDEAGTVQGAECATGPSDGSSVSFQADVPEGTVELLASMRVTSSTGPGNQDLDLYATDATGTAVAHTPAPHGDEDLHLWAPNLDGAAFGAWTFTVSTCAAQEAEFTLTVTAASEVVTAITEVEPTA